MATRPRAGLMIMLTVVLGAAIASCAGSQSTEAGGPEGGALPTKPPTTARSSQGTSPVTAQCLVNLLQKAALEKFPEATVESQQCSLDWAISTVFHKDGPKQGLVGFYQAANGGWTLLVTADPYADLTAVAPPGFPPGLIENWKRTYIDPTKTTTSTRPTSTTGGELGPTCGGAEQPACETTTTKAPTTTSTAKATTTTPAPSPTPTTPPAPTTTFTPGGLN